MSANRLNGAAAIENALTLAEIASVSMPEAEAALGVVAAVTFDPCDDTARQIAGEVEALLSRTVQTTFGTDGKSDVVAELVIGNELSRTQGAKVYLSVKAGEAVLQRGGGDNRSCARIPRVLHVLIACVATGAVLQRVLPGALPGPEKDTLVLRYAELGLDLGRLLEPIDIGRAYLAGAGAVGNGFLWAVRHLNLVGRLDIVDDDCVSKGNLNRQVWFGDEDVSRLKAVQLAAKAGKHCGGLALVPRECRLQDLPEKSERAWLERLIVGVDSRRARRALQNECPGEVFDASTTDISEVVLHHNRQPMAAACLSCVYPPDEEEYSRERHIAERLEVAVDEVRRERVSPESARKIVRKYPQLACGDVVGVAFDTLFKRLCSEGELDGGPGKRVVAPFAFVSALAGAMLALEVVRRLGRGHASDYNYWRLNPWSSWESRLRETWPRQSGCTFCGNANLVAVNSQLWGSRS